ncbi:hypothetical protein [Bradyrhizobium sp. LA6.12]|uniref:hypothetical protein n=1 Tax=unclassified Bradyrhizobium TaxID=2631580 RepID=UPI0033963C2B
MDGDNCHSSLPPTRLCACGCGTSIEHKRADAKFVNSSHRSRCWKSAAGSEGSDPGSLRFPNLTALGEKLRERGMLTFEQEAKQSPEEICIALLRLVARNKTDFDDLIA